MSRAIQTMHDFAKCLVTDETSGSRTVGAKIPPSFQACEKLRPYLATLMGHGGYRALLSRALALATEDVPWLRGVRVKPDGTVEGLEALHPQLGPDEVFEGRVALLTQVLELLVAFIGEDLTARLVRETWPKVPFNGSVFGQRR